MSCQHCGATLPETAMFCGECGSAVAPAPRAAAPVAVEPPATGSSTAAAVAPPEPRDDTPHCGQCGASMGLADIFCAECGFVAKSVADAYLTETRSIGIRTAPVVVLADPAPSTKTRADAAPSAPAAPEPRQVEPARAEPPQVEASGKLQPTPDQAARAEPATAMLDTEATRLVVRGAVGARFVLQFSTGEQAVVTGTGLLGRNPGVQPGERFDHVVSIRDPGRSVSKTHLEFGQDAGEFWVLDRFSGNGSVIRQPDHPAARCEPGRRYRIARGTRVDIGEQFFVVS